MSDDTDKAAREWAREALKREYGFYTDNTVCAMLDHAEGLCRIEAFKAGASHALSRPLIFAEEQAMAQAICDHLKLKTAIGISELNMARAAYSALQRMRTRG
jgi:hypothetical protein